MFPIAANGEGLQVEVRKPIVNPGGLVVACSMEFAAVLRTMSEKWPTNDTTGQSIDIVSWDEKCRATEFTFQTASKASIEVRVRFASVGKPAKGKKYLVLGQESDGLNFVCSKLGKETSSGCLLFEDRKATGAVSREGKVLDYTLGR
jgi:hypothetical protein